MRIGNFFCDWELYAAETSIDLYEKNGIVYPQIHYLERFMDLKQYIRDIPDFPKEGIVFKDITPLLKDPPAFKYALEAMTENWKTVNIDAVMGIESRGFIFGGTMAMQNNWKFVPLRKEGKLPYKTVKESYSLEYGTNTVELHQDALEKGENVLIVDDLLATGGTLKAAVNLTEKLGARVAGIVVLIELTFLRGKDQLKGYDFYSVLKY